MFSMSEMRFMIDALNGVECSPDTLSANLWGWVPYAGQLAETIEPNVLIGKVDRLSRQERALLHAQLEEFWTIGTVKNIDDRIREVGLSRFLDISQS